jgi:hypothetical protein
MAKGLDNRYYYRPGTTEPELRPEFANAPEPDQEDVAPPLPAPRGALPEDFPGHLALAAEGITTYGQLRKHKDLTKVPGIGQATAMKISEALAASSEGRDEG